MVCDRHGWPLAFTLSPGQEADSRHFVATLESIHLPGGVGRPRKRSRYMVADKGYDSNELRRYCDRHGIKSVIAQRNITVEPGLDYPGGSINPNIGNGMR